MVHSLSAQLGLLAFGVALVAGLYAGNSATLILARALGALCVGVVVGHFAGWAAKSVLRDHLQRKKSALDQAHYRAVQQLAPEPPDAERAAGEPQEVA
jgi:hypothetical protein